MSKTMLRASFLIVFLIFLSLQGSVDFEEFVPHSSNQSMNAKNIPKSLNVSPDYGRIPLYFIPNEGQVDEKALFYAKTSRYTLWLTKEGLVFDSTRRIKKEKTESIRQNLRYINSPEAIKHDRDVSRLVFVNANRSPEIIPVDITGHKVNYFIGRDKSKWRANIKTSKAVLYREIYPNIDLKIYGIEKQIEYDFVVKPNGEVSDIGFEYNDVEKTRIDGEGNLVVETKFGELEHAKPVCYQKIEGERIGIQAEFKMTENNIIGFVVEEYNKNYDLIIDPLVYSTYMGGSATDKGYSIAVDSEGAVYVTGETESENFPTKYAIQGSVGGMGDAFITKINASGTAIVYSTFLGGSDREWDPGIAVDSEGAAYVTGFTMSIDFPTQNPIQGSNAGGYDAFITKINASGTALVYSTCLGGSGWDESYGIAVDSEGAAYVTGRTRSIDFPTRKSFQGSYVGGDGDAFITKVNTSGSSLVYSTYLGGSERDVGLVIAVDSEGAVYVAGDTDSIDFPLKNPMQGSKAGGFDAFITKIKSSGKELIFSTYLGGSDLDGGGSIAVNSEGAAYVAGETASVDFPTKNSIQGSFGGADYDGFIAKINSSGSSLLYSTYLGGSNTERIFSVTVDSMGTAYVTGVTESENFPIKNPIQGSYKGGVFGDAFITKIASERIRIVSWNILDYPNMNEEPREMYFRSLLRLLDPDILVVQEMASAGGVDQFLKEVLNHKPPRLYKAASFFDGPDTDNALFYKKAKVKLISHQQIPTSFRDITEYKLKIIKGTAKGTEFKIYSVHFSEGAGSKKERQNEALALRTYLDGFLPDELFVVCGSFNMMKSTEKAFKILTGNRANNKGRLMDPIYMTGKWHDKSKHSRFHTESTRKSKFGSGVGGGLDDRFDMILISYGWMENEKLIYLQKSYDVFGNDGKHLNKSINEPGNRIVSSYIAHALYKASDHLPVIIDLVPKDDSK